MSHPASPTFGGKRVIFDPSVPEDVVIMSHAAYLKFQQAKSTTDPAPAQLANLDASEATGKASAVTSITTQETRDKLAEGFIRQNKLVVPDGANLGDILQFLEDVIVANGAKKLLGAETVPVVPDEPVTPSADETPTAELEIPEAE